ncbi:hypothetical protein NVV94_12115 [Pseudomonas sp. LS1212]|uniref:hypothetical protein n=1 Tax=Pseudomonas sp. LS1212 TaxID=2972478 RepID=UPI00215CC8CF|nr:hypothetical protein [Pseudomonas sp. LS1212]UVJ46209.1 hypothetical protein NVV94_12115 [Pseudomonas sp. LS1212]
MATLTFDGDPVAEARVLVMALAEWLKEQPEQPPSSGKAGFKYDTTGKLQWMDVTLDEAVE